MEMAVKMMKGQREVQGGGGAGAGAGSSFPAADIMGESRPLAPSFMASWDSSPMEMGSMGEAKTWLLTAAIYGWRSPPRVRFPPFI
jgi:hypothetical protein